MKEVDPIACMIDEGRVDVAAVAKRFGERLGAKPSVIRRGVIGCAVIGCGITVARIRFLFLVSSLAPPEKECPQKAGYDLDIRHGWSLHR